MPQAHSRRVRAIIPSHLQPADRACIAQSGAPAGPWLKENDAMKWKHIRHHHIEISRTAYDYDEEGYLRKMTDLVAKYQNIAEGPLEIGRIVLEITKICAVSGVIYPMELTLLGKTLMSLDQTAKILDPGFDPNKALREHAGSMMRKECGGTSTPSA
jgi:YD repeat-containing protein